MAWTNDVTLEFIELYRRERVLWDPKHPQSRNRTEISEAWMRIQSLFSIAGCSIIDLKKKKESLMTSFRTNLNRKKKDPHHRVTWFAYSALEDFLGEKYLCDNTNELENEFFNEDHSYTSDPTAFQTVIIPEHSNKRQYVSKSYLDKIKCKAETPPSPSNSNAAAGQNLDEYDLYGQLLAKKLRKLDEQQRDLAMHEIDNIMFRAKMQSGSQLKGFITSSPSQVDISGLHCNPEQR